MIKIKIHPMAVKFEEVECCALRSAIASSAHEQFIRKSIERAQKTEPKHSWSVLTEIFQNTVRLIFIPAKIHRSFYSNLAACEKTRLEKPKAELHCVHTIEEHIEALINICFMMALPKEA